MSSKTNTTTKYGYGNTQTLLKGSVVLYQPGLFQTDNEVDPLFESLKSNVFSSDLKCAFCENVLSYTELSPNNVAIKEIKTKLKENPERNVFVKTKFANHKYGYITTQASELKQMIDEIKKEFSDVPIVLIGYDKGGVVNCKCAIDNEGLIDKIVNIGTPHDETSVRDLIQIIGNVLKDEFGTIIDIPIKEAQDAIQCLVDNVNHLVDNLFNELVTYKDLRKEWNAMTVRPKFTPIAGEAIVLDDVKGDFIVPTESAMANGFKARTYLNSIENFIVSDQRVCITTSQIKKAMGDYAFVLGLLSLASKAILDFDVFKIIEVLYDIIANTVQNDGNFSKCLKLAHNELSDGNDFLLTHNTIIMRVLAGLNA